MRKILSILISLLLIFSFVGCQDPLEKQEVPDLKVGFIYIGPINDGGYTQAHHEGTLKMVQHFKGQVEAIWIENVNDADKQDSYNAALNLIDQGCDVVVGCSYGYMDALDELANSGDYDDIVFLHFSGNKSNDTNFENYFGAIEDARFLTGMIAGEMTETNKLGYVGAYPYTEVQIGINAFTLGAQYTNPEVEVKVIYINSWGDAELEKSAAEELLSAGCDVIAQHCDSTAPQIAAGERNSYSIGYNYPNVVDEDAYLTAAIWHHEVYLIDRMQKILDGNFVPENYYGSMAEGYVGVGAISTLVPLEVQGEVAEMQGQLSVGDFKVFSDYIEYNDGRVLCEVGQILTIPDIWATNGLVKGAN